MREPIVGIIGASSPNEKQAAMAREVGRLLGERGVTIVTGGHGGVMEAASRGASEAGALVIGILMSADPDSCNAYVKIAIPTGLGDARNAVIANTADAFIAVGGGLGTLTEIAFALKRGKPVLGLDTWEIDERRLGKEPWRQVATPEDAVEGVLAALARAVPHR